MILTREIALFRTLLEVDLLLARLLLTVDVDVILLLALPFLALRLIALQLLRLAFLVPLQMALIVA